ncbi:MAG: ribonuclease J [Defluviitaleaceae bacterium]|nr:ribonuclease J [Defluviitaleaceae bacterium]
MESEYFLASKKNKLKVFSLGGLQEIGKNITVFEYGQDIIVVDCGIAFPADDMLGIDLVIPDFSYLVNNKQKIKAIVLTHGHEDHIGSIPYLLRDVQCPIYGTRLTLGLLEIKLKEHRLDNTETVCVVPGQTIKLGNFSVEFIAVTHSIADAVGLAIKTPTSTVVHTGDFKIDHTPVNGEQIDLQRFAELGRAGVDLFLCDSTNVEVPGYTLSERSVGAIFEQIFDNCPKNRILVATFSSNIHRIQQVINSAVKHKRKVAVVGRSMVNTVRVAQELGYLTIPKNVMIELSEINNYPDHQLAIVTTGSQGEPMSALSRMAMSDHRQVAIKPGDKVVISASQIPGNERAIGKVVDGLFKKGADVITDSSMNVHESGHAKREELKIMHALVQPKYFMPVHGEYRHLKRHKELAVDMGMKKENVFVMNLGEVLEINDKGARLNGNVQSGQIFVDGLGVGDVGNIVLRDRRHLSQDGLIVVVVTYETATGELLSGPDIISRGFVYVRESEELIEEAREIVKKAFYKCEEKGKYDWLRIKNAIRDELRDFMWQKTKRSPMILPVVVEI